MHNRTYPPTQDPEKIRTNRIEEPNYDDRIDDPDRGELPETEPDDDEEFDDIPGNEPVRA